MARKVMTNLYYKNSADARHDCEILGIDKRRVINLRAAWARFNTWTPDGEVEVRTLLRVAQDLLDKLSSADLRRLRHVDDESYW